MQAGRTANLAIISPGLTGFSASGAGGAFGLTWRFSRSVARARGYDRRLGSSPLSRRTATQTAATPNIVLEEAGGAGRNLQLLG